MNYPDTYDGHLKQELVKMPYPPLVRQNSGYLVVRGKGKNEQTLYFGYFHDVARLLVNTIPGAHLYSL